MNKPISFKPNSYDAVLLSALLKEDDFKNKSDVIREGLAAIFIELYGYDVYKEVIRQVQEMELPRGRR